MTERATAADKVRDHDFRDDILAVADNPAVPTMLETVCLATGLRFAAIARVNDERWITCSVADALDFGLGPGDELVVESTLCHEVRQQQAEIVINDAQCDDAYRDHRTPRLYGFRSYLSVPILRPDGSFFGTLCALDPEPNRLDDPRILDMARMFARMVGDTLQVQDRLKETQGELARERRLALVQEEFMAILAHDLRNPVGAIGAGLRMLSRMDQDPPATELIVMMEATVQRMASLVNNLMDHARNRLGGGIVLDRSRDGTLGNALRLIVAEFRAIAPGRRINAVIDIPHPVSCDRARIAQLLSNLLGNAVAHGAEDRPIDVSAQVSDGIFRLHVANEGKPIPPDQIPALFAPFNKGSTPRREGLGLGLYIAAEIARAHGGSMAVSSDAARTVFTFEMPCG
ncbi:GAF domain-containing protein [Paracoccus sp. YIM 132242]|uniref:histidine kinase n=1 Tax=Paracoccus lichenicola TaxID=2665644 RepID=A0A6L6HQZ4_9RHOB|nr:GAF domain-containing sensor histidine kinase [Paracoccus lichenicola]MTE01594.1 GAF domain-containing protein [Paracoccus lichenicola]